jgi:hypothetical protein
VGEKTFERGNFDFGAGRIILILGDGIGAFFKGGGGDWKSAFLVFGLRNLVDCYRGVFVAESFGLGGQESLQNPRARELDSLCS